MTEQELITKIKYCYYDIRKRVCNKDHKDYKNYGGRGIELRFSNWQDFYMEVREGCFDGAQLDRINVNGHYEAGNLRWVTCLQNRNNCKKEKSGVIENKGSFNAVIKVQGINPIHIGSFRNKLQAIQEFRKAHVEWHGEKIYKKINGKYEKIFK